MEGKYFCTKEVVAWSNVGLRIRQHLDISLSLRSTKPTGILTSTLPQQFCMSFTPHQSLSPAPFFAGDHVLAKILNHGVEPSAVRASETFERYAWTGPQ